MISTRNRRWLAVPAAALIAVTTASVAAAGTTVPDSDDSAAGAEGSLAGICPETVVMQTDWNPQAEHGWFYELIGDDYEIDTDAVAVRGPLTASGVDTGVTLEIRSGGPAIGYQTVTSQIYADDSILLGFVYTDEAIQNASEFPTVAVYSGMDKNPQIILWDPETYPDVHEIADLKETGASIHYFSGGAYMDYFVQSGIFDASQALGDYGGTPDLFVAAGGADAQQGFGSAEPYLFEHVHEGWMKPVAYAYVNDAGWENYAQSFATKPENIETYSDCFTALVPMIQQATIDYINDPARTNALIIEAVAAFDNGWVYDEGVAAYAAATMLKDGLIANGPNGVIGEFDMDRVNRLIEIARPIYAALGQEPPTDLTAEDIVTNQFIDPTISL